MRVSRDLFLALGATAAVWAFGQAAIPAAEPADSGGRCIYGKTPLRPEALELLPAALDAGFTAVIGGRLGMATGVVYGLILYIFKLY